MSDKSPSRPWVIHEDCLLLKVRLTPKSQKDAIEGILKTGDDTVLKARVRAIPSGGAANRALEKLCAKWLSVPKSSVSVSSGPKSRIKTLCVTGDASELEARIKNLIKRDNI